MMRASFAFTAFVLSIFVDSVTGFDYYGGAAGPKSTQYNITLIHSGKEYYPHVYGVHAPQSDNNTHNENSVNNWIEFEQYDNETTEITIKRLIGDWSSDTHIRPISYGIKIDFTAKTIISFNVTGNSLHLSVHYGGDSNTEDPDSAYQSSMLIFITKPDIIPNYDKSTTNVFESNNEYKLTNGGYPAGQGVFSVNNTNNKDVNMIILQRGAWVYGKIFINVDHFKGIYGTGILSGRYFSRDQRLNCKYWNQCIQMVNTNGKECDVIGLTTITPNFRLYDIINGNLRYYRGIGWMGNNGGGEIGKGSILEDSFFKTDDDTVKFHENVTTKNIVLWHGYNAAAFQWGAFGQSYNKPVLSYNWTIIASENTIPNEYDGTNTEHRSNAIFAKPGGGGAQINGPFEFHNFVVDCQELSNLILWQLDNNSYIRNIEFHNLLLRGKITHFNMMNTKDKTSTISDISFYNFTINGKQIMDVKDTEFKLDWTGNVDVASFKFYDHP